MKIKLISIFGIIFLLILTFVYIKLIPSVIYNEKKHVTTMLEIDNSLNDNNFVTVSDYNTSSQDVIIDTLNFQYENAVFEYKKLDYIGDKNGGYYKYKLQIYGEEIELTYVTTTEDGEKKLTTTKDYTNLPLSTIYINTELEFFLASIPTVYEKNRVDDTIQINQNYEKSITIEKEDGFFYITYIFPTDNNYLSEFYYLSSNEKLLDYDDLYKFPLVSNELTGRYRALLDGFYQPSYTTYEPYAEGNYFRNCANFIATSYLKNNKYISRDFGPENEVQLYNYIGYSFAHATNSQMSEYGFFETESRSDWLYKDFGIEKGFYDTRFNSDNAEMNLIIYELFSDNYTLNILNQYIDFFLNYASENSYKTDRGILVEDYYHRNGNLKTHVSLNHHISNLNVLLSLYNMTNEQKYLDTALLMLYGVEDTKDDWILEDGNLIYALYYDGEHNVMTDYPYLTYNDLFICRERLEEAGIKSEAIEFLMKSKESWMKKEGITGYYK